MVNLEIPEGWVEIVDGCVKQYFKEPICCHKGESVHITTTLTWVPGKESGKWYAHDLEAKIIPSPDFTDNDEYDGIMIPGNIYVGRIGKYQGW